MAASVIDTELIVLRDNWPTLVGSAIGPTKPAAAVDSSGWEGQNVAEPSFTLGTKFIHWNEGTTSAPRGHTTFIYLKVGTQNADLPIACAVGTNASVCCTEDASENSTSAEQMYLVTNDSAATNSHLAGLCAIGTGAVTDGNYGWFWCGGVAPVVLLTGLVGDADTDANVEIGDMCLIAAGDATYDPIGFGVGVAASRTVGIAMKADD